MEIRKKHITRIKIAAEWDNIVEKRHDAIENGKDISLISVNLPCILRNLIESKSKNVVDIGCGSGYLSNKIAEISDLCYGVDMSKKSIELAKKQYQRKNLHFVNCATSDFITDYDIDTCVANMYFMTDPEWLSSIKKIYDILSENGVMLVTITHPCFWPQYWGFQSESWFDYSKEMHISHDFSMSLVGALGEITYIHRPLSQYINAFLKAGFEIEKIEEPYPCCLTPNNYIYDYPRFLFIKCKKKISKGI